MYGVVPLLNAFDWLVNKPNLSDTKYIHIVVDALPLSFPKISSWIELWLEQGFIQQTRSDKNDENLYKECYIIKLWFVKKLLQDIETKIICSLEIFIKTTLLLGNLCAFNIIVLHAFLSLTLYCTLYSVKSVLFTLFNILYFVHFELFYTPSMTC